MNFHFTLWNPNGLTQAKWDNLVARLPILPKVAFFTESHHHTNLELPSGYSQINNPNINWGVTIVHHNDVSITDVWKDSDGRVITCILHHAGNLTRTFLGYWPATNDRGERREFNDKHAEAIRGADLILGDSNSTLDWKRDSTWTRNHPSPGLPELLSDTTQWC